jgi:hypothetical protein
VLAGQHAAVEDASDEDSRRRLSIEDDVTALFDSAQSGPRWAESPTDSRVLRKELTAVLNLIEVPSGLCFSPSFEGVMADVEEISLGLTGIFE